MFLDETDEIVKALKTFTRYNVEFDGYDYILFKGQLRYTIGSIDSDFTDLVSGLGSAEKLLEHELHRHDITF